jgi:hypothetical protein
LGQQGALKLAEAINFIATQSEDVGFTFHFKFPLYLAWFVIFFFIIRSLYQKTGSILHWELAGNDFGGDGLITVCDALSRYSPIRRLEISNNFVPRGLLTKSAASNQRTIGDALADLANSTIARLKCQITPLAFFYILSLLVFARLFAFPVSLTDPFRRGFFFCCCW